jgi:hypothetical protein
MGAPECRPFPTGSQKWPFHYLRPDLNNSPSGKGWQWCLKPFIDAAGRGEVGATGRRRARRRSRVHRAPLVSFEPSPVTLPSQR